MINSICKCLVFEYNCIYKRYNPPDYDNIFKKEERIFQLRVLCLLGFKPLQHKCWVQVRRFVINK